MSRSSLKDVRGVLQSITDRLARNDASGGLTHETVDLFTAPAFLKACKQGNADIVAELLNCNDVNIDTTDPSNGRTGLHKACAGGHGYVQGDACRW